MNIILKKTKQMRFHTDMKVIFDSMNGELDKLNWLITDLECNYNPDPIFNSKSVFIKGKELSDIINKYNDLQFIWAVFSGFPESFFLDIDISGKDKYPYANGNPTLWDKNREPQHKDALIEIVCWDSSETIFTTKIKKYIDLFANKFIEAK